MDKIRKTRKRQDNIVLVTWHEVNHEKCVFWTRTINLNNRENFLTRWS